MLLLIGALLSGGCLRLEDPEASQDYHVQVIAALSPGHSFAQSLVSRRAGLTGISLWLAPDPERPYPTDQAQITFDLYGSQAQASLHEIGPLASIRMPFSEAVRHSPLLVDFPTQPNPPHTSYYLQISLSEGDLLLYGRDEEAYPEGSAFLDGVPLQADLGFQLTYEYGLKAFGADLVSLLSQGWLALPLAAALLLPGWLLLDLLGLAHHFDGWQAAAASLGLSLALIPVAMLWSGWLGLQWRPAWVIAAFSLMGLAALWRGLWRLKSRLPRPDMVDLGLLAILAAALAVRMVMARDLAAPPWVDSVHHGLITRLILERGAFPDTLKPFVNAAVVSYHPGFHSVLAVFQWLSGMELTRAMLLLGQALNGLSVLAVYLLTTSLVESRAAGLAAAFITALVSPMPAYYTSWGRYTHLAGLLILPLPLALIKELFGYTHQTGPGFINMITGRWKPILAAALASGGLFLTHYRVTVFMAALLAAWFVARALEKTAHRQPLSDSLREAGWMAGIALLGILSVLPWLIPALSRVILPKASLWAEGQTPLFSDFSWGLLTTASGLYALALAGVGLAWGFIQRRWFTLTLILWAAFMFLAANLGPLGLPGGGLINNLSVEISLFMPISLLGGYILSQLNRIWKAALPGGWRWPYFAVVIVIGAALGLAAARRLIPILNPITFLFRQADRPGIAWVAENVPPGEGVLINPFAWGYGLYAGADGGYWISALAGRRTLPPPVIYGLSASNQYIQDINQASQEVIENGSSPEALARVMRSQGLSYIYLGARGGVISSRALMDSPLFEVVFSQGEVWVFRLR